MEISKLEKRLVDNYEKYLQKYRKHSSRSNDFFYKKVSTLVSKGKIEDAFVFANRCPCSVMKRGLLNFIEMKDRESVE